MLTEAAAVRIETRLLRPDVQRVAGNLHQQSPIQECPARNIPHQGNQGQGVRAQRGEVVGLPRGDYGLGGGAGGCGYHRSRLAGRQGGHRGWCETQMMAIVVVLRFFSTE